MDIAIKDAALQAAAHRQIAPWALFASTGYVEMMFNVHKTVIVQWHSAVPI